MLSILRRYGCSKLDSGCGRRRAVWGSSGALSGCEGIVVTPNTSTPVRRPGRTGTAAREGFFDGLFRFHFRIILVYACGVFTATKPAPASIRNPGF